MEFVSQFVSRMDIEPCQNGWETKAIFFYIIANIVLFICDKVEFLCLFCSVLNFA